MTYIIVGNGPAGISAIERIRELDPEGKITLVSAENNLPYSRIMTPEYMTDEVEEQDLFIRTENYYQTQRLETRLGHRVVRVLPEQKQVILDNGEQLAYDRLLLATGSSSFIPRWIDAKVEGIFSLWNKEDAEAIKGYLSKAKKAAIIGGGLVGLQAARALTSYGVQTAIIEMADRLMPAQLDQIAADMLGKAMSEAGVEVWLNTRVESMVIEDNRVNGVKIADGTVIDADIVLVAIGVRPNLDFLEGTTLEVQNGLLTNEYMQTNSPDIFAAGDIVQANCALTHKQLVRALWLNAVKQGKTAGSNMAGVKEAYPGNYALNSIQLFGLPIISAGQLESGPDIEEITLKYPSSGAYQKLFVKNNCLVGLLFVGDVQQAGVLFHKLGKPMDHGFWGRIKVS